jgi:alkylhydroperoxidase/carboxymuconolactone decarboxylase family protein YurZ
MLTSNHQRHYDEFYRSTHNNEYLDEKTELLVGLSAAMAMNCAPCTEYYLNQARSAGISHGEISEVLAKVMAVAAGQKRLQMQSVLRSCNIDLTEFE